MICEKCLKLMKRHVRQRQFILVDVYECACQQLAKDELERVVFDQYLAHFHRLNTNGHRDVLAGYRQAQIQQLNREIVTQFEVEQTRERTRDTYVAKVSGGNWMGSKVPYGYRRVSLGDQTIFEQVPNEALIVRNIFTLYMDGHGLSSIAQILNDAKSASKRWTKESVKSIVMNPVYTGYVSMNKVKKNAHASFQDRSQDSAPSSGVWFTCVALVAHSESEYPIQLTG